MIMTPETELSAAGSPTGTTLLSEQEIHREARRRLVAFLQPCWTHRALLLQTAAYGLIAGLAMAFLLPIRFQSTARLMPPESATSANAALLSALGGTAHVAPELPGMKSSGALLVGVLGSESVQDAIIDRFELRKLYACKTYRAARRELADRSSITEDRKSGLITIKVSDRTASRAAAMAQAYLDELDRVTSHVSTSAARRERIFLEERLKAVRQDLDSAQRRLSEFSSRNSTIDPKEQGRSLVQAGAKVQGELIAAQAELKGLQEMYGEENVRVRASRARIAELNRELRKFGGGLETRERPQVSDVLYPPLRRLPLLGATFVDLYRQTEIGATVHESLTRQYELAKVQEAKEIPTVRVLDPPKLPEERAFPPRLLIVLAGTWLGLLAGLLRISVRHFWTTAEEQDPVKIFARDIRRDTRSFWNRNRLRKAT